jgi:hypothetical protein
MAKGKGDRRQGAFARLGCCWLILAGFSPSGSADRLDYQSAGFDEEISEPPAAARLSADAAPRPAAVKWRLSIDTSILADSNVTNSTDKRSIDMFQGETVLPVPLDPSLRARADIGAGVALSAGVELPIAGKTWLVAEAEGYALDYGGGANDDISLLAGVGPRLRWDTGEASVQLLAFDRWYGGISAQGGWGVRGRFEEQLAPGERVTLTVDARIFESDYGDAFEGGQAGAYLSYARVLNPLTTASVGLFARRDWLGEDAYSSLELGAYGGISRYLGPDLTGSLSGGVSRLVFDAPVPFLSPDPREDWRFYASASLTTRRPVRWGVHPSLSYSYNRTWSSVTFFDAARHRVRLGLSRNF